MQPTICFMLIVVLTFYYEVITDPHVIISNLALAGVAHWIECWPVNQRVPGSISGHGTCLVGARSPVGLSLIHI